MSNLSVQEYESLGKDAYGDIMPAGKEPGATTQNVSFTTTSVQSSAFGATTRLVRVVSDVDARILFGSSPTAIATSSVLISAGQPEYFGVDPGDKVAVITAA